MASGYDVNGVDLDTIFAPYTSGTQAAATGYLVGGVDLNQRYAPLSAGSAALVTGFDSGGADLNTFFAAANTTTVTVGTQPSNVSGSIAAGDPTGTVTSGTTTCAGANGTGSYSYTWHIASGSASFTNPNSATTAVTASVNADTTLSGTMYCTISDGISSVNTNTVSWSLTNTTIPVSVGSQPSNVTGSSAAGDPAGTVTSNTTSCSGANGTGSYSYAWHIASGSGVSFTAPNSATTAVTGTVNAASTLSGTMYCTIKDSTGGTINTSTVSWSLQNTSPAFSGQTDLYTTPGSHTETIPTGATTMVVEVWGGGASGGVGEVYSGVPALGGGGGAGGYSRSSYNVSGSNGKTISLTVGSAGASVSGIGAVGNAGSSSTVSSGSYSISTMTGSGGSAGTNIGGGSGGTASGGTQANTSGGAGAPGSHAGGNGAGGTAVSGNNGSAYGAGGSGGTSPNPSASGGVGAVKFTYT